MTDVDRHAAAHRTEAAHAGIDAREAQGRPDIDATASGAQGGAARYSGRVGLIRRIARVQGHPAVQPCARSPRRRAWMLGAFASAAGLAFASAARIGVLPDVARMAGIEPALAAASAPASASASADKPPAGGAYDAFIALSGKLTGHTRFDPVHGKRAYDALSKADSGFAENVAALNAWLATHGGVPSDLVTQALEAQQPQLAKTVGAIARAWYLGLVGEMPNVQVIAFERALMFEPVNDILTVPSYCRDVPFYWTRKPTNA
jgi:fructose 5-dehydrogenase small subunit